MDRIEVQKRILETKKIAKTIGKFESKKLRDIQNGVFVVKKQEELKTLVPIKIIPKTFETETQFFPCLIYKNSMGSKSVYHPQNPGTDGVKMYKNRRFQNA